MNTGCHKIETVNTVNVFLENAELIRKIIFFYIKDEYQADDIFQDFFLSFISRPLTKNIQNIESYLYKAITNDIVDYLRRKDCEQKSMYEYCKLSCRVQNSKTPEEIAMMMDDMRRIFHLIKRKLSNVEAQAVYLQYKDNLNANEISEKMDVSASTIRGYVSKGLCRIRGLLGVEF